MTWLSSKGLFWLHPITLHGGSWYWLTGPVWLIPKGSCLLQDPKLYKMSQVCCSECPRGWRQGPGDKWSSALQLFLYVPLEPFHGLELPGQNAWIRVCHETLPGECMLAGGLSYHPMRTPQGVAVRAHPLCTSGFALTVSFSLSSKGSVGSHSSFCCCCFLNL